MIEYKLIREIDNNSEHTQRTLATEFGVSLGKINHVISGFTKIGLIQARKIRDHHDKIRWKYYLTPKGVKEKTRLAGVYYNLLTKEYEELKRDMGLN